uniref:Ubiquinone biosynthesis protein UbiE n=1 Tax=uncultured archaeon Rifle_16ft_4_minimus_37913 TaxID=1665152 RepID=A0A0H4T926_9ARCH|nr:ubiquinone biosynthesis protein UbiE [uncultured archaeon Rifle_16ft_4_minimus_37913]
MKSLYKKEVREDQYKTTWNIYPEVLKKMVFKKNDKILDAGCGTGELAKYLNGVEIYGVDSSETALKKSKKAGYKKILKADIYSLPFEDKKFDKTMCIQVFQYLENPEEAFLELKRVTKDIVIITVPNFKWLKLKTMFSNNYREIYKKAFDYVNYTDSDFLKNLARKNGLKIKIFYISNNFSSFRNFLGDFLSSEVVGVFKIK